MEFRKSEYLSSGLLKLICVPLFFLAFCLDISARRTQSGWNANLCSFSEAYRAEGWKIPGLLGAKKKTERASLSTHPEVFATMLDPGESEVELMSPKCPREFPGRLTLDTQPIKITELWKFDIAGKVFAYGVKFTHQAIENGVRINRLAVSQLIFYDTDGSGSYTLLKYPQRTILVSIDVPAWVK
jgi:hypothetical protein